MRSLYILLLGCGLTLTSWGGNAVSARTYILVHGAFQDREAWTLIAPRLESAGHRVLVIQRPGRPPDSRPPGEITLGDNVNAVLHAIEQSPGPVVLVGHSFAGIIISQAAEAAPDRVETLVYVAAYLPRSGESLRLISSRDPSSELRGFLRVDTARGTATVAPEGMVHVFCADAPDEMRTLAVSRQIHEPLAPLATPVQLSADAFGRIRKVYVLTTQDRCISPDAQRAMLRDTPVDRVFELSSSHSPFWSKPDELSAALLSLL